MHETRNLVLILLVVLCGVWGFLGWFVFDPGGSLIEVHQWTPIVGMVAFGGWTWYALTLEDKMPDHLAEAVGPVYYEADGLAFMPTVRMNPQGQTELSLFYQNRYENYVTAIIHMRPPGESFVIKPGLRDVHFSFKADGGDFGVLHQPIAVPKELRGEVIEVELAAVSRFPRSHGTKLCSHEGLGCGSFVVDWGQAFKAGVHEVSGEIELKDPVKIHLSLPPEGRPSIEGSPTWRQELVHPGPSS